MDKKLKLVSVLLVLAIVLSMVSISMSLNFKDVSPVVSREKIIHGGSPVGNIGLVVEKNNFDEDLGDGQ